MTKRFLTPISLANLSADPTGSAGAFYYNTSANTLKYYNGSTWVTLGSGPTGATAPVTYNSGTQTVALNIGSSLTTSSSNLIVDSTVVPYLANSNTFTADNTFAPTSTTVVPLTVNLPSGSSQNLLNLRNNGTSYFSVAAFGYTYMTGFSSSSSSQIIAGGATQIPLKLKGAASQTADLAQFQNSAGTILGGFNAAGQLYAGTTASVVGSTTTALTSAAYTSATVAVFTYGGASLVQAGQTVTVAGVTGGAYNGTWVVSAVTSTTFTVLGSGFTNVAGSGGTFQLSAVASFVAGSAAITPLVVQAATSQTASMQQWQNSAGVVLSEIRNGGQYRSALGAIFGSTSAGTFGLITAYSTSATIPTLYLQNAASQTADAMQITTSAGTVLGGFNAAGQLYAGTTASVVGSTTTALTSAAYTSATVAVFTYGGTSLVQAGQRVTVAGVTGGAYNGTWVVSAVTSTTFTVLGSGFTNVAGSGGTFQLSAVGSFVSGTAAITPLIVQGAASQTANLQEWQNSAGSVVTAITTLGILQVPQINSTSSGKAFIQTNGDTNGFLLVTNNAANKGLVIRATASQTANLQEWQDSTGTTVLASVSSAGVVTGQSFIPTSSTIPTNGIYLPAANTVGIATNGASAVQIGATGKIGIGVTPPSATSLNLGANITGGTSSNAYRAGGPILSDVTSQGNYFVTAASTQAAAFTLNGLQHFYAVQGVIGAGSTVTNQYGFQADSTLIGATNNYGFAGYIPAGTNRWNLYMVGTAANYLAGPLTISPSSSATGYSFTLGLNITGATSSYAIVNQGTIQSDVTAIAAYNTTSANTQSANFALATLYHYSATQPSTFANVTAGGSVGAQVGFYASSNVTGATNNYGFYGNIASGTSRWNLFMNGTANNYVAGSLGIGDNSTMLGANLSIGKTLTGATAARGIIQSSVLQSDVTGTTIMYASYPSTVAAAWTSSSLVHFVADFNTLGASSLITTHTGFQVSPTMATAGSTNVLGYRGRLAAATGVWNLYMDGTAANYMKGPLGIGDGSATAGIALSIGIAPTGATTTYGINQAYAIQGDVTGSHRAYYSAVTTAAAAFTLTTLSHFYINTSNPRGAGSAVTNEYGYRIEANMVGATNNYGYFGGIPANTGATVTAATGDGTTVTYTAANTFSAGQVASITGLGIASGSSLNLTSVVINSASSTQFTVLNATVGTSSGTGTATVVRTNWNIYMQGTAPNYLAGQTAIGSPNSLTLGSGSVAQQLGVVSGAATTVGAVIRGAISQTANLQEWQNSAGTPLVYISSSGNFIANNGASVQGNLGGVANFVVYGTASNARISQVIQQGASQTGDALQIQNGAGTTLGGANALAQIYTGSASPILVTTGGATTAASGDGTTATITTTSAHGLAVGDLVTVAGVTPTGYNATAIVTVVGSTTTFSYLNATTGAQTVAGTVSAPAQASVTTRSAGTSGLVVKAVASQTADLQEWQNSSGTSLVKINAAGSVVGTYWSLGSTGYFSASGYTAVGSGTVGSFTNNNSAATVPTTLIKAAASQTADLQEWQNSAGTILGGANAAGQIYAGTTASKVGSTTTALTSAAYTSATVAVFTYGGTSLVQAGQTVTVAGVTGGTYNGTWVVSAVTSTTFTVLGSGFTNVAGSGGTFQLSAVGSFVSGTAAITPLIVQGAASQTANLQEWQNSAGTVLVRITNNGDLSTANIYSRNGAGAFIQIPTSAVGIVIKTNGASNSGLIIQGTASQTADLQQWQNSAGTILGGVNALAQTYTGSTSPILVATGGATTAASGDGTTATITTTSAHGLAVGDLVTVAGVTPTGYNATAIVTVVGSTTTFSYLNATTGAQTVAGTVSAPAQASVTSRSAGTSGLVVKGATSQTANLLSIINSTNETRFFVDSNGAATTRGYSADTTAGVTIERYDPTNADPVSALTLKSYGGTIAIPTAVINNARLGLINAQGWDGTNSINSARIIFTVDGTVTTGSVPGRITFNTAPAGGSHTERMRIDSNGLVGIGATPSGAMFTVVNNTAGNVGTIIKAAASQAVDLLQIQNSAGTKSVFVDANGALGIGVTAVASGQALEVAANGSTGVYPVRFTNLNTGSNTTKLAGILFGGYDTVSASKPTGDISVGPSDANYVTSFMRFSTRTSDVVTERLRIDSSGNVGIGTTSPSTYSGTYKTVNAVKNTDQVITTGAYWQSGIGQFSFINSSSTDGVTGQPLVFQRGSAESMRIDTSGNVGIGTSTPVAKLDVNGSINATNYSMAGKNVIINGGFDFFQRGSFSTSTTGYALDRWWVVASGSASATVVTQQTTGVPNGSRYCMRMAMGASGGYGNPYQYIESSNVASLLGQTVTFSIKLRRNATFAGNLVISIDKSATIDAGSGATWTAIGALTVANASLPTGTGSSNWYTATITTTVPNDGTANSLRVRIEQSSVEATGAYWEMAQAQLELGSVATPFSRAGGTIQGELALCQRYYYRTTTGTASQGLGQGFAKSTTVVLAQVQLPVTMRTNPSTTIDAANLAVYNGAASTITATIATIATSPNCVTIDCTGGGFTINTPYQLLTNTTAAYIGFSAEL